MFVRCLGITAIAAVLGLDAMGAPAPQQRGGSRPAAQEDTSRQAGAELLRENGEPVLRFGVGHLHTTSGCYGYLYFTPTTIRYEVVFDGKDKGHSFQKLRSEVESAAESYYGSLQLKFRGGGNYRFQHFHRDRIEAHTLHGRVFLNSGVLTSQPMILAANDFQAAVRQADQEEAAQRTQQAVAQLQPAPAAPPPPLVSQVIVQSQPGNAQVYLDNAFKGISSAQGGELKIEGLAAGSYRLRLTLPGYKEWNQQVSVPAGATVPVSATLVPAGPKPLDLEEIEEALKNGISKERCTELVKQFGVDFALTPERESRLRNAGADSDLLLLIVQSKK